MNYSKEYMDFLEGHRRSLEFKDKMKKAALASIQKKIEDSFKKREWDKYKEVK